MNFDKRTLIFIGIFFIGITGYNYYLQQKYPAYFQNEMAEKAPEVSSEIPPAGSAARETPEASPAANAATDVTETATEAQQYPQLSPEELTFETETRRLVFDQTSSALTSIVLKDYYATRDKQEKVELLPSPFVLQGSTNPQTTVVKQGYAAQRNGNTIRFTKAQENFEISQTFEVPDQGYGLGFTVDFKNTSTKAVELDASVLGLFDIVLPTDSGGFGPASFMALQKTFIYSIDGSRSDEVAKDHCEEPDEPVVDAKSETLDFVGFDNHYFLSVIHPLGPKTDVRMSAIRPVQGSVCSMKIVSRQNQGLVQPGETVSLKFSGYFGPKDLDLLADHGPEFTNTVQFGWFSIIAKPLLAALKFLYGIFGNYGIAIILVTVALKILFYPLTRAAAISMKKMQKLQPEMTKLREKYKGDPARQQKELMAFMGKHKVNPAKGCLPILPQIPVFIAFYNVLSQAIELRHAPFFGWIEDMSVADPYYISPILLGVGMMIQQKLTPNPSMDKNQAKIMMLMPLIFTVMMLSLPAGMVLYMIANTAVSILQQQWLNRKLAKQFG